MIDITGSKSIFNKAEVEKIIIEGNNVTIAFNEGYDDGGTFVPVGADHLCCTMADITTDEVIDNAKVEAYVTAQTEANRSPEPVEEEEAEE